MAEPLLPVLERLPGIPGGVSRKERPRRRQPEYVGENVRNLPVRYPSASWLNQTCRLSAEAKSERPAAAGNLHVSGARCPMKATNGPVVSKYFPMVLSSSNIQTHPIVQQSGRNWNFIEESPVETNWHGKPRQNHRNFQSSAHKIATGEFAKITGEFRAVLGGLDIWVEATTHQRLVQMVSRLEEAIQHKERAKVRITPPRCPAGGGAYPDDTEPPAAEW